MFVVGGVVCKDQEPVRILTVVSLVPWRLAPLNVVQLAAAASLVPAVSNPGLLSELALATTAVIATEKNPMHKRQMIVLARFSIPRNLPSACMIAIPRFSIIAMST